MPTTSVEGVVTLCGPHRMDMQGPVAFGSGKGKHIRAQQVGLGPPRCLLKIDSINRGGV